MVASTVPTAALTLEVTSAIDASLTFASGATTGVLPTGVDAGMGVVMGEEIAVVVDEIVVVIGQ